jgi:hypothetical protein
MRRIIHRVVNTDRYIQSTAVVFCTCQEVTAVKSCNNIDNSTIDDFISVWFVFYSIVYANIIVS